MAEFTVQEMFDLIDKCPSLRCTRDSNQTWVIGPPYTAGTLLRIDAYGTSPEELRVALKERAVPTAEEAEVALHSLPVNLGSDTARLLARFIDAHKDQPDG